MLIHSSNSSYFSSSSKLRTTFICASNKSIDSSKFFGGECIDGRDFSVCEDEIKKRVKEMGGIGLVDVEYKEIEKREYEGRSYFRYRIVGKLIK